MIDLILDLYAATLKDVEALTADIDDARFAEQPAGVRNHPAWTLGHLVVSGNYIVILLDEKPVELPENYGKLFPPGTVPSPDRETYPSKQTLFSQLKQVHNSATDAVRRKHASYFDKPSPENLRSFAPTLGKIITYLLAAHENNHLGQLIAWRRAAGIKK